MTIGLKLHIIIRLRFDKMRILVFEDTYDILELVKNFGINLENTEIKQYWDTRDHITRIDEYKPDILMLDYYISPITGLQLLQDINEKVSLEKIKRPKKIIGISSSSTANFKFLKFGADAAVIKFELNKLEIWNEPIKKK